MLKRQPSLKDKLGFTGVVEKKEKKVEKKVEKKK